MSTKSQDQTTIRVPDYEASPRQTLFHQSKAEETLYGGAAGGGKTAAIVAEHVTTCLEYPGITTIIFRKTIPELKKTVQPEIMRQCAQYIKAGFMKYNSLDRIWQFANGSQIYLGYLQYPGDEFIYQGAEFQLISFDELTHFQQYQYEYLQTRLRDSSGKYPLRIMSGTNPGGVGHGWVKARFIDICPPEQIYTETIETPDGPQENTRIYIPAKVDDHPNQKFKEQYKRQLNKIEDPDLRRALRDGDWDVFAGQVFTEFRRHLHVIEPFRIPDHWPRWSGYDYGYNTKAAKLWLTKDPQTNRKYIYREYYITQASISKQSDDIKRLEGGERVFPKKADPALWKGKGNAETGETVAQMFEKQGIRFEPANNDRLAGKQAWHEALSIAPDGKPYLQIFSNCTETIRTIPALPYDQHRVEDVDTDAEDHLYDAGRYALVNERQTKKPKVFERRYDADTGRLIS